MATESQLTISPPNRSATASESAVLPLPVGPAITTSNGSFLSAGLSGMPVEEASIAKENDDEADDDDDEDTDRLRAQYFFARFFFRSDGRRHRGHCSAGIQLLSRTHLLLHDGHGLAGLANVIDCGS